MKTPEKKKESPDKTTGWLIVSGIAFVLSILASSILIFYGKQLESIGIVGNIYYIILIPLGLSSAAFLGGAMKSYASYTTNESFAYGKLKLAGPVVIFALVVGGGFIMPNFGKENQFDLKFRILSDDKATHLFNEGKIILYIGQEPKTANINDGEASFYNIPESYNNKSVKILPVIDKFQLSGSDEVLISSKDSYIDVKVERTKESMVTVIRGSITNMENEPVQNALVNFDSGLATGYTDQNGDFSFTVPKPAGEKVKLKVLVDGLVKFDEQVTLSSSIPINLKL
ncbi:MAG: hypothetical protein ACP5D9_03235 [Mariniphaga sp.]